MGKHPELRPSAMENETASIQMGGKQNGFNISSFISFANYLTTFSLGTQPSSRNRDVHPPAYPDGNLNPHLILAQPPLY